MPDNKSRVVGHLSSVVDEVEDVHTGKRWALKRLFNHSHLVGEADRLARIGCHPLIVALESIFVVGNMTYLQMPLYTEGNLRTCEVKVTRQAHPALSVAQKRLVQQRLRQVMQAVSYIQQKGIVHRDLKPKNVLIQKGGTNIALCDFGISKDLVGGAYQSTATLPFAGTVGYAAPEAVGPEWKLHPTAVDSWAVGIMLLELACGQLPGWVPNTRALVLPDGRLLTRDSVDPSGDAWCDDLWNLTSSLCHADPAKRPSLDAALQAGFFTNSSLESELDRPNLDAKFRLLHSHLDALRNRQGRTPGFGIGMQSLETLVDDMLAAFSAPGLPLFKAFYVMWGPSNGARKPLQEALDMFFQHLTKQAHGSGLLMQSGDLLVHGQAFLPCKQSTPLQLQQYVAFGRLLAKCLLEGVHVPVNFSTALHSFLVGDDMVSVHCSEILDILAAFDPEQAQRARQTLVLSHGSGGVLDMTGIRHGFQELQIEDHLQQLNGAELAALFFGDAFLDIQALVAALHFDLGNEPDAIRTAQWMVQFIRNLSETNVRVFLARATGGLHVPTGGAQVIVMLHSLEAPIFHAEARVVFLANYTSYDIFAARMVASLRLGEHAMRTAAQQHERLTRAEQVMIKDAMRGEIRPGAFYRCPNRHLYAIDECGGAMEVAVCGEPGCGERIGGQQHRLLDGNRNALDFDEADAPAWN
ncbi:hypothetical protein WJX72_008494 [[Myrmecia] bisecta]|uniref:mitogen-activated protein kinase kinase n=1 Tax=[Myrmecia] bisecta TaxID=41462 RepID=A0AAW1PN88_9CHLO